MNYLRKNKRILISISIFLLIGVLIYMILYYTENVDIFLLKIENRFNELTILSIVFFFLLFIYDLFKGWLSSLITNKIFPGDEEKILNNTNEIKKSQNKTTKELLNNSKKILEQINFDPRRLNKLIKELNPIENNKNKIIKIEQWYNINKISFKEKETLVIIIKYNSKTVKRLEKKILRYNEKGDSEFASSFEKIKESLKKSDATSLRNNYFSVIKKQRNNNIVLLKETINASLQLFAYKETKELYKELIELEPIDNNHNEFGLFLLKFEYINEAIIQLEKSLELIESENTNKGSAILNNLGCAYNIIGNFDKSIEYFNRATKNISITNKNKIIYLNNLALAQKNNNELNKSIRTYLSALELNEATSFSDNTEKLVNKAFISTNLGILYSYNNDIDTAENKFNEALNIYLKLSFEDRKKYLTEFYLVKHNLAIFYSKLPTKLNEAFKIYEDVLDICKSVSKVDKSFITKIAEIHQEIANLHIDNNNLEEAVNQFEMTLDQYRQIPTTKKNLLKKAGLHNDIGNFYRNIANYKLAHFHYSQSLHIYNNIDLKNNITHLKSKAIILNNFGVLYKQNKKYDLALEMYNEALNIRETFVNEKNLSFINDYAESLNNIGALELMTDKKEDALIKFERVLEVRKQISEENPSKYELIYARCLISYSIIFQNLNYLNDAELILDKYKNDEFANQLKMLVTQLKN